MKTKLLCVLAMFISFYGLSQNPGTLDTSFNSGDIGFMQGDGFNGTISETIKQPDGKILVLGNFSSFNGQLCAGVARLNTDNTLDTSFNSALPINSAFGGILHSDGKVLIRTSHYLNGGYVPLYRLNNDGSMDTSFTPCTSNQAVRDVVRQSDGKYIAVGSFTTFNGASASKIVRINADGSLDTNYVTGSGFSTGNPSYISIQADNKTIISGSSLQYNGQPVTNSLARINTNGTLDTTFSFSISTTSTGITHVLSNGQILVARHSSGFGFSGQLVNRISSTGSYDNTFSPVSFGNIGSFYAINVQPDGKVLFSGNNYNNGLGNPRMIRRNSDGTVDTTFQTVYPNSSINTITSLDNGEILISGSFLICNNESSTRMAKLTSTGALVPNFEIQGYGVNGSYVSGFVKQPDGKILVNGSFQKYNNEKAMGMFRIHPDGTHDNTFSVGTGPNINLYDVKILNNGTIAVAGLFTMFNGVSKTRLAFLNDDGSFNQNYLNVSINNSVQCMVQLSSGKLLIAGGFSTVNGQAKNRIALLNGENGSIDNSISFGTGFNNQVMGVVEQPDGKLIVYGYFTEYNGAAVNPIIRLSPDGTLDTSFDVVPNSYVRSVALLPNGKILLSGQFTVVNGVSQNFLTQLNSDGSIDTAFQLGTGFDQYVSAVEVIGNHILISGGFTNYNGNTVSSLIRLNNNGTLDSSFAPAINPDGFVSAFQAMPNDRILIGGNFTQYDGVGKNRLALIYGHDNSLSTIKTELMENVKIYPNPTTNVLNIKSRLPLNKIEVVSIHGQIVKTFTTELNSLNLGSLQAGFYILKLYTEDKVTVKQFIRE